MADADRSSHPVSPHNPSSWLIRLAGSTAMLLALATLVLLRIVTGLISLFDAIAQITLEIMPLRLFSALVETFGTNAKAMLLLGIIVVITLIGGLVAPLVVSEPGSASGQIFRSIRATIILAALGMGFLYWAIAQRDNLGLSSLEMIAAGACVLVAAIVYAAGAPIMARALMSSPTGARPTSKLVPRRDAVRIAAAAFAAGAVVVLGREVLRTRAGGFLKERHRGEISSAITPTSAFYRVSSNFRDPTGDGGPDWTLTVDGRVDRPRTLSLADLKALAGPELTITLNCISNEIGGPLISTGIWSTTPLARVIAEASPQEGVIDVVFSARDGYSDSVPIQKANAPECQVAWGLNGEPLTAKHGAPARALIPGIYGMKSVKWLNRITLVDEDARGYWEQRGWSDDATVKPISRFDVPVDRAVLDAGMVTVGGVAWAGMRGVKAVQVSMDGEQTWQDATLVAQPGPYAWVIWQYPWAARPGTWHLTVRLVDGTGALQPDDGDPPLPDGASGWHRISVGVV